MTLTIKNKLLLILSGLTMTVAVIAVVLLLNEHGNKRNSERTDMLAVALRYYSDSEKNRYLFLNRDINDRAFYQNEYTSQTVGHQADMDSLKNICTRLISISPDKTITDFLEDAINSSLKIKQSFNGLTSTILNIGRTDYGLSGQIQYHLRMVKMYGKSFDNHQLFKINTMIMSYRMYHTMRYADSVNNAITEYENFIKQSCKIENVKEAVISNLEDCRNCFELLINSEIVAGIVDNNGYVQRLEQESVLLQDILLKCTHANEAYISQQRNMRARFELSVVILLLLFNIAAVHYVTSKIGKPITLLTKTISDYIKSDFKGKLEFEEFENTNGEIKKLASNCMLLSDLLQRKNTESSQNKTDLVQSLDNLRTLGQMGQDIISSLKIDSIVKNVYKSVKSIMSVSNVGIGIYNPKLKSIEFSGMFDISLQPEHGWDKLSDKNTLSIKCFEEAQEIFIDNYNTDIKKFFPAGLLPKGRLYKSMIYEPLKVGKEVIGVFSVKSDKPYVYKEIELMSIRNLTVYIAIAVQNALTYEKLENERREADNKNEELKLKSDQISQINHSLQKGKEELQNAFDSINLLNETGKKIASVLNIDSLAEVLVNDILKMIIPDKVSVGFVDYDTQTVKFTILRLNQKLFEKRVVCDKEYFKSLLTIEESIVNDFESEYKSKLTVPISANDKCSGLIIVESFVANAFDKQTSDLLGSLAGYAAVAAVNAQIFSQTEKDKKHIADLASDLKNYINQLEDSQNKLSHIINFIPDPMLAVDIDGKIIAWNKSMETLTGVSDVLGKDKNIYSKILYGFERPLLCDLVLNPDKIDHAKFFSDVKFETGNIVTGQTVLPGNTVLRISAGVLRNSEGIITGAIQLCRNVTDIQSERESLRMSNEALKIKSDELNDTLEELRVTNQLIEDNNKELERLSLVADRTDNYVLITNENLEIEWINRSFEILIGYNYKEYIEKFGKYLCSDVFNPATKKIVNEAIELKRSVQYVGKLISADGNTHWLQASLTPIFKKDGSLHKVIIIDADITKIKNAEAEIERSNEKITYSIQYANRIQKALLTPPRILNRTLGEHFILLKPRDIVSGDFYWTTRKGMKLYIAGADCTGHGVPGAFMSVMGISFLNEIVNKDDNAGANIILDYLRENVIRALHQKTAEQDSKDGMDIALCVFDLDSHIIDYSGANIPLYLRRHLGEDIPEALSNDKFSFCQDENGKKLWEIKPDRMPVGMLLKKHGLYPFSHVKFKVQTNDIIYIASDGYHDQLGGPDGRKILTAGFKKLLLDCSDMPMEQQKLYLENYVNGWMNTPRSDGSTWLQVDDIMIFGIKF